MVSSNLFLLCLIILIAHLLSLETGFRSFDSSLSEKVVTAVDKVNVNDAKITIVTGHDSEMHEVKDNVLHEEETWGKGSRYGKDDRISSTLDEQINFDSSELNPTKVRVSRIQKSEMEHEKIQRRRKRRRKRRKERDRSCSWRGGEAGPEFRRPEEELQQLAASHLGHRVELECPARRGCPPASLTWYRGLAGNGTKVEQRDRSSGLSVISIKRSGLLVIEDNRPGDDGLYTCVVENLLGRLEHSVEVQSVARLVARPPELYRGQPGNHTVVVGSNITLLCQLTVTDPASPHNIHWYKHYTVNGSWVNNTTNKVHARLLQRTGDPGDDQELHLLQLSQDHSGWYSCVVSNQYGKLVKHGYLAVVDQLPGTDNTLTWLALAGGLAVLTILAIALLLTWLRYRRERRRKQFAQEHAQCVARWTKKIIIERSREAGMLAGPTVRLETVECEEGEQVEQLEIPLDEEWEFPRELLSLQHQLGQGNFGRVMAAEAHRCRVRSEGPGCPLVTSPSVAEPLSVAVKMLKPGHTEEELISLVKEIEIMKAVGGHPNIVNLLGACTGPPGRPLLAVLELAELGNLRDHLLERSSEAVTAREMLQYGWQVGLGMQFLASRQCLHRDLAARNVLLDSAGTAKVADFGLARDMQDRDYYRVSGQIKLPVLWMSPESLWAGVYTTQSDVWSFGVLLGEITTGGARPYGETAQTERVLEMVRAGWRMERPARCPGPLYSLMLDCWAAEPGERPSWDELVTRLAALYSFTPDPTSQHNPGYTSSGVATPPSSDTEEVSSYPLPCPASPSQPVRHSSTASEDSVESGYYGSMTLLHLV